MDKILTVKNLTVAFVNRKRTVHAVNDLSFELGKGELLAIVGESGCGKTVTCLSILQLNRGGRTTGEVVFEGHNILKLSEQELRVLRGRRIAMIFQNPSSSLNPVVNIGKQVMEVIQLHSPTSKERAKELAVATLKDMGIPEGKEKLHEYPHQQSGGTNQRIMIAMALSCNPDILIADEPTASLDVTVQKQIMKILEKLKKEKSMGILFVTHNLGLVHEIADRVLVVYHGMLMEEGQDKSIFENPLNPYTRALISSLPLYGKGEVVMRGEPPSPFSFPLGCPYASRCQEFIGEVCVSTRPKIIGGIHKVRCHWYDEKILGTGARKCEESGGLQ